MAKLPTRVIILIAGLLLAGCGGSDDWDCGYQEGFERGYEAGLAEGRAEGTAILNELGQQWGLIGLAVGLLLGALVLTVVSRKDLARRWRAWTTRRALARRLAQSRLAFDPDVQALLFEIGDKRRQVLDAFGQDRALLVDQAFDRVRTQLTGMNQQVVRLAEVLQGLRDARKSLGHEPRGRAGGVVLEPGENVREALTKNAENANRCWQRLVETRQFLDHLILSVANLKLLQAHDTLESPEKDLADELHRLERTYEATLQELRSL